MGNHVQPNYAAANTSLDAFVLYRHSLGLPASVLDSGVMEDIRFVSKMNNLSNSRKASSIRVARAGSARSSTVDAWPFVTTPAEQRPTTAASSLCMRTYVDYSQVCIGYRYGTPGSAPNSQARAINTGHESNSKGFKEFLSESRSRPVPSDLPVSIALLAQEAGTTLNGFRIPCDEDLDLNVPLSWLVRTAW